MPDGSKKYKGMLSGLRIIATEEGLRNGVYKGIEFAMVRDTTYGFIRYGCYEPIKR